MNRISRLADLLLGMALLVVSCQKAPELTITSSPTVELNVDGSSGTITFSANRAWTVSSSDSWVTISPSSGEASDKPVTVTVRCNANTTYDDRTATVTIRMEDLSQSVTVKQPANKGVVLPKQVFDLQSDAKSIDVEVQANVQYTVSISADWIKQTGTKGLTSKTLTFSIEENKTYDPREGKITIKPQESGVQEQVISVRQAQKDALIVEKTSYDMPYGGGEIEIKVEANVDFEVTPNADWIHHTRTKALSNSTVCLKIDENMTYSPRQGKVEIKQQNGSLNHMITVNQAGRIEVTSVELDKTSLRINAGDSETLVATVKPDNASDKTVTWTSSDDAIATVDETGRVTAIKEGSTTITAKAGEKKAECKVSVYVAVSSIELNLSELVLYVGGDRYFTATIKPENATVKTVTWSCGNDEILNIMTHSNNSCGVYAKKEGETTVIAAADGKEAECKVKVIPVPASSITIDVASVNLKISGTTKLNATVSPENTTYKTVKWSSSDEAIASVDETGTVTALMEGSTTITAECGSVSAECEVSVQLPNAINLGITMTRSDGSTYKLYWADCNLGANNPEDNGDYYAWGEVEKKDVYLQANYKWTNDNFRTITKYCPMYKTDCWGGGGEPDDKRTLDPDDDAAHIILGGNWRMPTKEEFIALMTECKWYLTTQNGKEGYIVRSRGVIVDNHVTQIFLPKANESGPVSYGNDIPKFRYWTSSLYTDNPNYVVKHNTGYANNPYRAYYFEGSYDPDLFYLCAGRDRVWGMPIRAVREE